jgi:UDP-glucose 4-epimerase
MTKILITGAGGYIGSVATYLLLQNNFSVVALDNFSTGYRNPLQLLQKKFGRDKLIIHDTDLRNNLTEIFEREKDTKAVLHYAASCSVNESMEDPGKYYNNNVAGSINLINTMVAHGINNLVFSSTCAVYGEAEYVPVDEKHPTSPANPYGHSKRMVEEIIDWFGKLTDLNFVILRYFNVCGASDDGLVGDSKKPSSLLVQNAVRGAMGIEKFYLTCPEVNTPDKTPIRDYINVVDLNEAHLKAVKFLLGGGESQIINLGTGSGNSVLEVVETVEKITGKKLSKEKTEARKGEYAEMIADISKAEKILKWEPKREIKDSVNSLVKWYKAHPQGWKE